MHDATEEVAPEIIGAQQMCPRGALQAPIQVLRQRIVGTQPGGQQGDGEETERDQRTCDPAGMLQEPLQEITRRAE